MKLSIVVVPVLLGLSSFASAQERDIYKCEGPEGVGYQDTACTTQLQTQVQPAGPARKVTWQTGTNRPANERLATMPLSASVLYVGMTDTQVLNLPSCGRPASITRTKGVHTWQEQWTYRDQDTGEDRRVLYFENGRLVKQEYAPRPTSIEARATTE